MAITSFTPYKRFLHSENGALNSTGFSGTGGAITAALFLEQFVDKKINWVHFDLMAWILPQDLASQKEEKQ